MQSIRVYTSFEELKSDVEKPSDKAESLLKHQEFEDFIKKIRQNKEKDTSKKNGKESD